MFAVIFPGQGSQSLGMAKDFYDTFPTVKKIFEDVKKTSHIDINNIIFEDRANQLNITEFTQICIFCVSISIFSIIKEIYRDRFCNKISFMAGHSLGEYTALTASEVIKIDECSKLLKLRGKYMQNSYPENESVMLAIIGLSIEKIESILQKMENKRIFEVANHNGISQVVLSLKKDNISEVSTTLNNNGAKKIIQLNVSAGFHSSFMELASRNMTEEIDKLLFDDSKYPIVSNYNADATQKSSDILYNLKQQMTNKVRWVDIVKFFEKNNVKNIIEIGPNKVLNGLNKRISNNFTFTNVSNIKELDDLKNVL